MALIDNLTTADVWDYLFQFLLFVISAVIAMRYGYIGTHGKKHHWYTLPLLTVLIIFVYICLMFFFAGTARGTGLEHPIYVLFYMIGGACAVVALDGAIKAIDKWMLDVTSVEEE